MEFLNQSSAKYLPLPSPIIPVLGNKFENLPMLLAVIYTFSSDLIVTQIFEKKETHKRNLIKEGIPGE